MVTGIPKNSYRIHLVLLLNRSPPVNSVYLDQWVGGLVSKSKSQTPIRSLSDKKGFPPVPETPALTYMVETKEILRITNYIGQDII
jgi:hypothetical protein